MKCIKIIVFYIFIRCSIFSATAQITVDDTKTEVDLVKILTNSSPCVSVSGEKVTGDPTSLIKKSYGSFDKNGSVFPLTNGIVLSTWSATNSRGPFDNNKGNLSTWSGDADLEKVLGITTVNATVLEFDFIPQTNFINFNYLFASNEYQKQFPCNYSDGFAFLIKESKLGSTYTNIAVIPGTTTTPVSSQNIHLEINSSGNIPSTIYKCPAINGNYYGGSNTLTSISPINYAGQTIPMTAQATVTPGTPYHIKLVIADNDNSYYNSAVFLEAGSFSSKIDLGSNRLLSMNNPVCFGETITLSTNLLGSHKWTKTDSDGTTTALTEPSPSLVIQDAGIYQVEVTMLNGCKASGEIKIEYAPEIILNDTPPFIKCADNAIFDLTKAETKIKDNDPSLTKIDYYETQIGSTLSNPITNPTSFTKTSLTDQTVYAEVTSIYGCTKTAEIKLQTIESKESTTISTTPPIVNDFAGNGNSVTLIPPSTGTYEFSLDGTNYQDSPLFSNLAIGNYIAYVRDLSNCEYLTYPINILDYPRFFTPNGDGINDDWEIKNLDSLFPNATITIYDRYGKLLQQLNSNSSGWDGKFNGIELPATDYWFNLNLENGRIIKGHFSLKR